MDNIFFSTSGMCFIQDCWNVYCAGSGPMARRGFFQGHYEPVVAIDAGARILGVSERMREPELSSSAHWSVDDV